MRRRRKHGESEINLLRWRSVRRSISFKVTDVSTNRKPYSIAI